MSALGTSETTAQDVVPYFARQVGEEQGRRSVRARVHDLPAELRLRPRRRRAADVHAAGQALAGRDRDRQRPAALAADLGRGRRGDLREVASTSRRPRTGLFELGGPDTVDWNGLYRTIAKVLGKRSKLVHVPVGLARTGARLTERLPGAPLSVDQVSMIQGADNVVSNTDAVDTFQIPLVPLEEQIRRSA